MNKLRNISSILTSIKNGYLKNFKFVFCKKTKINKKILLLLYKEGLILGYVVSNDNYKINLRYYRNQPIMSNIKTIYKPSLKKYDTVKNLEEHYKKYDIFLLSTDFGIISSNNLIKLNLLGKDIGGVTLIGITLINKII